MTKSNLIKLCFGLILSCIVFQVCLFCQVNLRGETVAFIEQSIAEQEQVKDDLTLQLAKKTNLEKIRQYASAHNFIADPETYVIAAYESIAYNW